jgi:4-amino-4-deoxy-L-arabinose transferase-like glycosyltransferase
MSPGRAPGWTVLVPLVLAIALGFLGTRGLWEPDEGRYVEVARGMLTSGDYLTPHLGEVPHFTKPPLTYWLVAAGLATLGQNEWGARLGHGLAFAATALLVAGLGARLLGPEGRWAGLLYATMVLPFAGGSIVTPDTLLALAETAALAAFWRGWTSPTAGAARRWMLGFWAGLGVAFLTKGPPALLPLLIVLPFACLAPRPPAPVSRAVWLRPAGVLVGAGLALPWFLLVALRHDGLLAYFLGAEVYARVATAAHHRNSPWYMGLLLYPTTLVLGTLPWSLTWPAARRRLPGRATLAWLRAEPRRLFLAAWILVPLVVLSLARSRLPLYLLPAFPALAVASAGAWRVARRDPAPTWWPGRSGLVALAGSGLLALRLLAAWHPVAQDTRAMARGIAPSVEPGRTEVVVVDEPIYGLSFYLPDVAVEMIARRPARLPEFRATRESFAEEVTELTVETHRHVFVSRTRDLVELRRSLAAAPVTCAERGGPGRLQLLVCDPVPSPDTSW